MNENYPIHEPSAERKVSTFLQYYDNDRTRRNYRDAIYKFLSCISTADAANGTNTANGTNVITAANGTNGTNTANAADAANDTTDTTDTHAANAISAAINADTPEGLDAAAAAYLKEVTSGRPVVSDLYAAAGNFSRQYAPTTANLYIRSVCTWLNDCGIALTQRDRQRIFNKIPPLESVRREAELTRSLFRSVYDKMTSEWTRVLLLVMLGSGMRLGEALSLRTSYVSWKKTYTEIFIPASDTKTKRSRTVYLTAEASLALKSYLERRSIRSEFLFPYSYAAAERQMRFAADALSSGKDRDRIRAVHWHMTRKWFISRFSLYASRSVAEKLAGHEGYLTRSYHRFTKRQILAQFKKAERYLSILPPEEILQVQQVQQVREGREGQRISQDQQVRQLPQDRQLLQTPQFPAGVPEGSQGPAAGRGESFAPERPESSGSPEKSEGPERSEGPEKSGSPDSNEPQQETVHHGRLIRLDSGMQVVLLDTGKYIVLNGDVTSGGFLEKSTS